MVIKMQFDLFEDNSELGIMKQEIAALKIEIGNIRRGIFARQGALLREVVKLTNMVQTQTIELENNQQLNLFERIE